MSFRLLFVLAGIGVAMAAAGVMASMAMSHHREDL